MTGWTDGAEQPGYGPLFQAALGGEALVFAGGAAAGGLRRQDAGLLRAARAGARDRR